MESIVTDFLQRGDVDSAMPVLSTLALGSSTTPQQRRKRLVHARLHTQLGAIQTCVTNKGQLTDVQREAICDAVLSDAVPSPAFFGREGAPRIEVSRRTRALLLAIHPDKCRAKAATSAVARLHERKEAYDLASSELVQDDDPDAVASAPGSPMASSMRENASPSRTWPHAAGSQPSSPKRSSVAMPSVPGSPSSPTRARRSRFTRPTAANKLDDLLDSMRGNASVRLDCDLSPDSFPVAEPPASPPPVLRTPPEASLDVSGTFASSLASLKTSLSSTLRELNVQRSVSLAADLLVEETFVRSCEADAVRPAYPPAAGSGTPQPSTAATRAPTSTTYGAARVRPERGSHSSVLPSLPQRPARRSNPMY